MARREATHPQGRASSKNKDGFIQMAIKEGLTFDASGYSAIEIAVFGNDEAYESFGSGGDVSRR